MAVPSGSCTCSWLSLSDSYLLVLRMRKHPGGPAPPLQPAPLCLPAPILVPRAQQGTGAPLGSWLPAPLRCLGAGLQTCLEICATGGGPGWTRTRSGACTFLQLLCGSPLPPPSPIIGTPASRACGSDQLGCCLWAWGPAPFSLSWSMDVA